jgi:hypothetical protein
MITSFRANTAPRFALRRSTKAVANECTGRTSSHQALELLGACSMIAAFLVLALFG